MTTFDIEESHGVWFDMDSGGRVKLKTATPSDWLKIKKAITEKDPIIKKLEDGKYQLFEHVIIDEDLQMSMLNDICIIDWENLFDKNRNPIPCTPENKMLLMMMRDDSFRDFVNEKMTTLAEMELEQRRVSEKN